MATLQDTESALEELRSLVPGFPHLAISRLWSIPSSWATESFPHSAQPGVYLFLDSSGAVLYIGKASFGLGARIGSEYIGSGGISKNSKIQDATALVTIPLDKQLFFLAPAIEEFLIYRLRPRINRIGIPSGAP